MYDLDSFDFDNIDDINIDDLEIEELEEDSFSFDDLELDGNNVKSEYKKLYSSYDNEDYTSDYNKEYAQNYGNGAYTSRYDDKRYTGNYENRTYTGNNESKEYNSKNDVQENMTDRSYSFYNKDRQNTIHTYKETDYLEDEEIEEIDTSEIHYDESLYDLLKEYNRVDDSKYNDLEYTSVQLNDEFQQEEHKAVPLENEFRQEEHKAVPLENEFRQEEHKVVPLENEFRQEEHKAVPLDNEFQQQEKLPQQEYTERKLIRRAVGKSADRLNTQPVDSLFQDSNNLNQINISPVYDQELEDINSVHKLEPEEIIPAYNQGLEDINSVHRLEPEKITPAYDQGLENINSVHKLEPENITPVQNNDDIQFERKIKEKEYKQNIDKVVDLKELDDVVNIKVDNKVNFDDKDAEKKVEKKSVDKKVDKKAKKKSADKKEKKDRKKSKSKVVLVIVLIIVILGAASVFAINQGIINTSKIADSNLVKKIINIKDDKKDNNSQKEEKVAYTKGKINGDIYENSWSGMQLTIPKGFWEVTEEFYNTYSTETTECGLYLMNARGDSIVNIFSDLVDTDKENTKNDKEIVKNYLEKKCQILSESNGFSKFVKSSDTTMNIAGKEHYVVHYDAEANGIKIAQSFYARKIDEKVETIIITYIGGKANDNDNIVRLFKEK